jgi:tRNA uridine 5-carbamoylmethylation protein Kti12
MTLTHDYAATTRRAESVLTDALDNWKNGLNAITAPLQAFPSNGSLPTFPQFDAAEAVELQFQFVKRVVDVNYGYARQLAEATNTVTDAVRQHIEGLSSAVLEQLQSVSEATQSAVDTLEDSVRETADEAEKAEREQRKAARDAAREHYRSLTKNELSDEAAKRNLRKTGTVDELVERLVADDTSK